MYYRKNYLYALIIYMAEIYLNIIQEKNNKMYYIKIDNTFYI